MRGLLERVVIDDNGCWLWQGAVSLDGYAYVRRGPRGSQTNSYVHRLVYEEFVEDIRDGYEIHHVCEVKRCVNPAHLLAVTRREHMQFRSNAYKTHCLRGHPFNDRNTHVRPDGRRECRACSRDRAARYRERNLQKESTA